MLECPVYDDLRAACPAFPLMYSETLGDPTCVRSVFQHDAQSAVAHTLYKMKVRRARLLGLTLGIWLTVVISCCSYLLDPSCQFPTSLLVDILTLLLILRPFLRCVHCGYQPV
jgi:hypothetical protein